MSVFQVVQALQAQNLAAPVGRLTRDFDERTSRLRGRLMTPPDFAQLVVTESEGRVVRLGDVATVRDGTEDPRSAAYYDQEAAVGIDIVKSKGFSTTSLGEKLGSGLHLHDGGRSGRGCGRSHDLREADAQARARAEPGNNRGGDAAGAGAARRSHRVDHDRRIRRREADPAAAARPRRGSADDACR
jgi:hypothetical protein